MLRAGAGSACADHHTADPGGEDGDAAHGGGTDGAVTGSLATKLDRLIQDAGPPPLVEVARNEIELYDRRIRATCLCLVEQGKYTTEEECLKVGLSGPDWSDCATKALESYDNAMTRAQSQCYFDFLEDAAECVEASKCDADKLAQCATPDLDCLTVVNERLNLVLAACPDFGLLSRLNP
jgi:hypothetical protein